MGKSFGYGKKGKISLAMDKPSYVAGEVVRGTIYVSVHEPIECDALILKATGKEKVKWTECEGEDDEEVEKDREHEFFKDKIVISEIAQVFSPGEYSYPFEYTLAPTLPGVFSMERYSSSSVDNLSASIKYKFKATLDVGGVFAKDIKGHCSLVVHAQLSETIRPSEDATTQDVNWLCCFNKGACDLAVAMDKNVYFPGDVAQITSQINNRSEVDISAMRCQLYQDLTLVMDRGIETFTREITTMEFPGVAAGQSVSQPQPLPLVPTVGGFVNPSTAGQIVRCAYRIEIECDIPWCPDVQLHLPVTIIAPVLPDGGYVAPATAGYVAPM